jgi:hypothetical protein
MFYCQILHLEIEFHASLLKLTLEIFLLFAEVLIQLFPLVTNFKLKRSLRTEPWWLLSFSEKRKIKNQAGNPGRKSFQDLLCEII